MINLDVELSGELSIIVKSVLKYKAFDRRHDVGTKINYTIKTDT